MTPLHVHILIEKYLQSTVSQKYDCEDEKLALSFMVHEGILKEDDDEPGCWEITDKGRTLMKMILFTPFPEEAFVNPVNGKVISP